MILHAADFESWRTTARSALAAGITPENAVWIDGHVPQEELPLAQESPPAYGNGTPGMRVPKEFVRMAERVCCHRAPDRFAVLYRLLWRITHGEHELLDHAVDNDVRRAYELQKAINRDVHKMHAFVRFRRIERDGEEWFIAWHRPDHRIVRLTAPFFRERFPEMRWTILTPDESVTWDTRALVFGMGVPRSAAPEGDELEDLWRTYYGAIFNPARVNLAAMRAEMPQKHWATMPETALLPRLLQEAEKRVERMIVEKEEWPTAAAFLPEKRALPALAKAAAGCRGCPLYLPATQTVFGRGPARARIMCVGEQPGDEEDRAGLPFIGPAGRLLDTLFEEAGLVRSELYVTNAVKHFKFKAAKKRRLHDKPKRGEVLACRPWLEAEIEAVQPRVIVALGATAAQALFGPAFRLTEQRGQVLESPYCARTIATFHPSALLRAPTEEARRAMTGALIQDLRTAQREYEADHPLLGN